MEARAVVAREPWKVALERVTVPDPGPEDVVVRVRHSWISNGTEGSFVRGERIGGDTPWREGDPLPFPHAPGYQKVGVVESAGSAVTDLRPGEWVFATVSRIDGMVFDHAGHVSPAVTHRSQVWKLPEGLDPVAASGLVLTQVGYNCGMRADLAPGDAAVVIGDGMVGHWSAQTLARRGARVLMLGRHAERLCLLGRDGETADVSGAEADAPAPVRQWAPEGVQAVVDTVGTVPTLEALLPCMRRHGHLVSAGFMGTRGRIDIQRLRDGELTLHAPSGWTAQRMDETLEWVRTGALRTLHLITHRFPVERAAEAFDLILSRREPVLGVVLDWEEGAL